MQRQPAGQLLPDPVTHIEALRPTATAISTQALDRIQASTDNLLLAAPVAQLDRVPGYEPGGRRFESFLARH